MRKYIFFGAILLSGMLTLSYSTSNCDAVWCIHCLNDPCKCDDLGI